MTPPMLQIRLVDGNMLQHVAAYGPMPVPQAAISAVVTQEAEQSLTGGRSISMTSKL